MAKKPKKLRKAHSNSIPKIGIVAPSTPMYPSAASVFNKYLELKNSRKKAKGKARVSNPPPPRRFLVRPNRGANHPVQTAMNWRAKRTTRTLNLLSSIVTESSSKTKTKDTSAFHSWFYSAKRGVKTEANRRSRLGSYRRWIRNRKKQNADGVVYRNASLPLKGDFTISIRMKTVDYSDGSPSSRDIDFKGIHQLLKNCDTTKWKIKWRKYSKDDYRRYSNHKNSSRQFDFIYATDDTTVFLINMNFPGTIETVFRHPTK